MPRTYMLSVFACATQGTGLRVDLKFAARRPAAAAASGAVSQGLDYVFFAAGRQLELTRLHDLFTLELASKTHRRRRRRAQRGRTGIQLSNLKAEIVFLCVCLRPAASAAVNYPIPYAQV